MFPVQKSIPTILIGVSVSFMTSVVPCLPATAASKVSVEGKVVLANVDKYTASFRISKVKKDVAPRKASVLTPKNYPLSIEVWNGARTQAKWVQQQINAAGVYVFRYQNGQWTLTRRESTEKKAAPKPPTQTSPAVRQPTTRRPSYRRVTGSTPRVVRGSGRVYRGRRFPVLYRVGSGLLSLYRFIRDEEDRDILRDIIIGDEIDREIEREFWDRLDDMAVNLPAKDRLEFDRALRDLEGLSDRDLDELDNATDEDWDLVRDELGDGVTDNAWSEIESDLADWGAETLPADEINDLDDVGIDTLDSNLDFGDLDGLDGTDVGMGDLATNLDDVDVGDLSGGIEDIDVGDLGGGFGGFGGYGDGGLGSNLDVGAGDLGSNLDVGGGGLGNAISDLMPEAGGGFDYNQGGFNDFGNNMGGGDWGAGDFSAPQYGGGFGGDFGGGFGGDFGGGFDDFGGGGFDDFGGGFDDFGGGFDF